MNMRSLLKGSLIFLLFAILFPLMPDWGRFSIYNTAIIPGRKRFAFSSHPSSETYNVRIDNIPALFNTHEISGMSKGKDEFRVIVLGDSSIWGTFLHPEEMITSQLNRLNLSFCGKQARFYNLGHPNPALIKDLMILDYAWRYKPDYIIWFITLEAFPLQKQVTKIPLVVNNPALARETLARYKIDLSLKDTQLSLPSYWDKTLFKQREPLKNLLLLNLYGVMWAMTGIDEQTSGYVPPPLEYPEDDIQFQDMLPPLNHKDLTYQIIEVVIATSNIPVLLVNEPMMHSPKSTQRYNLRYPHWAYDSWHEKITMLAQTNHWNYLDLGDTIPSPELYTDSAFHLTPEGERLLASYVTPAIRPECP